MSSGVPGRRTPPSCHEAPAEGACRRGRTTSPRSLGSSLPGSSQEYPRSPEHLGREPLASSPRRTAVRCHRAEQDGSSSLSYQAYGRLRLGDIVVNRITTKRAQARRQPRQHREARAPIRKKAFARRPEHGQKTKERNQWSATKMASPRMRAVGRSHHWASGTGTPSGNRSPIGPREGRVYPVGESLPCYGPSV